MLQPVPDEEAERLAALERHAILDTPPEESFDRITRLAAELFGVPIALVSLLDGTRQWFKSRVGLELSETPREHAFCRHTIAGDDVLVVADASTDPRFADNPLVTGEPHIRFYAGVALRLHDSHAVGTLCIIDRLPRELAADERRRLTDLGRVVADLLELRLAGRRLRDEVTAREQSERCVREQQQRLRGLADAAFEALLIEQDGLIVAANEAASRLFLLRCGDLVGRALCHFLPAETCRALVEGCGATPCGTLEMPLTRLDETRIVAELRARSVVRDGRPARVVAIRDVTVRRQAEERVRFLAQHDPLTLLPNRAALQERLERALGTRASHHHVGVMLLDLDGFKDVNDTLGHDAGDALLQEMAARLRGVLRAGDIPARIGGDEFALVLPALETAAAAGEVARRVLAALTRPISCGGRTVHTSSSIGIALCPDDACDSAQLLKLADIALYAAKAEGRGSYAFFAPPMRARLVERKALEDALREGLADSQFEVHYQPKVDLRAGGVSGVEALLRWRHPDRGLLAPTTFLEVAEASGLIVPLGAFVLRRAVREARAWIDAGLEPGRIAVNFAAAQFRRGDLVATIESALADADLPPARLEVEVTENVFLGRGAESIVGALERLTAMGVAVALDDFGTGYASLTHLKGYPVDRIKIDRSFVTHVPGDWDDNAIVGGLIQLAHRLGKGVVAEGIDSVEQLCFLRSHGCDEAQGYLIARPMPGERVAELLRDWQPLPALLRPSTVPG